MAAFEFRLQFQDPEKAKASVSQKSKVVEEYEMKESFFQPKDAGWKFNEQNMRLRQFKDGRIQLIYRKNAWQGQIKEEIIQLRADLRSLAQGEESLQDWGFVPIISYQKIGQRFELASGSGFVWEEIEHLGSSVEIEGENEEEAKKILEDGFSGIEYKLISKTVPEMVMEKINGN
ncbi:MAG: hypothetical protein Q8P13_01605 [bacterium]|nr:hypothetical protein [bacterium]